MRYCKKCTMPDTRPGITFDSEGVCSACRHYENRKNVDWDARFKEFEAYCNNLSIEAELPRSWKYALSLRVQRMANGCGG